jgi:YfiH family protein
MTDWAHSWAEHRAGGERFRILRRPGVLVAFGQGPRRDGRPSDTRLQAVARDFGLQRIVGLRQVHGCRVVDRTDRIDGTGAVEADGHVTREDRLGLAVWTADCLPVLLVSPSWIGAVHAGWRGAAAGILPTVVRELDRRGTSPSEVEAYVGPAIGPCHYPVGDEVRNGLAATGIPPAIWDRPPAVDLRAFAAKQLLALGLPSVEIAGPCTACDVAFASFRRDGEKAGRQMALVARTSP